MSAFRHSKIRFHDLDALRAVAMLLGILLHAALSFTDLPIWPAQDINRNDAVYGVFNDAVHGFRMPLFFLVSGFFTAMLAQKRGLRALAKHRTKRVLLPLVIGWFAFSLPVFVVMGISGFLNSKPAPNENTRATAEATSGETDSSALLAAAVSGDTVTARALLEDGADVAVSDPEKNQPLHTAAFFGHAEFAELLLEHGADPGAKNIRGDTPISNASAPWEITEQIGNLLQLELDRDTVEAGRAALLPLLTAAAEENADAPSSETSDDTPAETGVNDADLLAATVQGDTEKVRQLLAAGADVSVTDPDGNQPLMTAAFLGYTEIAALLLEHGADPNQANNKGETPMNGAHAPWFLTEMIAGFLQIEIDRETVESGRAEIIPMLVEHGAEPIDPALVPPSTILGLLAFFPLFNHLWFLYYLLWLVAAYIILSRALRSATFLRIPDLLLSAPGCLLWLVPLTLLPQHFMNQGFGPDTATGILPWPPIVVYYAIFFFFGAACFGRSVFHEKTGRLWPLYLGASIPLLLVGIGTVDVGDNHLLYSLAASAYAWLMTFAFIGLFRQFFHSENRHLRYISDASYWLYLAHLPLVMLLQIMVAAWDIPAWIKFIGICAVTYGLLIFIYEYAIRYTWAGILLNGKKTRVPKLPSAPLSPEP